MVIKALTTLPAFRQAISGRRPVVIDFWATWCGPCKAIAPVFEKFATSTEKVDFYKVDVDSAVDIAQEVGIRAMPTFAAFKDGSKIGTVVGADPSQLAKLVETALSQAEE
ncbi:hypothetical protein ONZ45_g12524 [Pleurotus djamor]|nr:hypothetical protein ONZ45_g18340 [Pleurotus djamor]KAJ8496245.1 hypothetical protein ONZ45_g12524 [Pleurotus djamor]